MVQQMMVRCLGLLVVCTMLGGYVRPPARVQTPYPSSDTLKLLPKDTLAVGEDTLSVAVRKVDLSIPVLRDIW